MKKQELIEKINAAVADEFEKEIEEMKPEASLKETLELDSLSLVDLVALIEEETGVKIKNEEVKNIKTFDDLYSYVYNHQAA